MVTRGVGATVSDYLSLLKPRVVLLHLLTATSAMFLAAHGLPQLKPLALVLLGGALAAGAANALNCYFDRGLDRTMARTQGRPLPAQRLSPARALAFGLACGGVGLLLLAGVSLEVALLALGAQAFYVLGYTLWLKRRTVWSTVLSSGIGAVPPLIGWLAGGGRLALTPFLLALVVALWTPPHFWALALARGDEYRAAGLPALPKRHTAGWILAFVLLTLAASLALAEAASIGPWRVGAMAIAGLILVGLALRLLGGIQTGDARTLYRFSVIYLAALFALLIASQLW